MRQPSERILQCSTNLDLSEYADPGDGRGFVLWLSAMAHGPIEKPACDVAAVAAHNGQDDWQETRSTDRLVLESKADYTEDEVYALIDQVYQRGHIQLSMRELFMHSEVLGSAGNDGFTDINGPAFEAIIRSNDLRITVELDYDEAGWLDTGLNVFRQRLFDEHELTHLEQRQWLLSDISHLPPPKPPSYRILA